MKSLAVAVGVAVALIALGAFAYLKLSQAGAVRQLAHAEAQAGAATVGQHQAQADAAATAVVAQRQAADQIDIEVHAHNDQAIAAAPGAAARVAPALNDAGRRGLCRYGAYRDDPGCAGLRQGDPTQLPPADPGGPLPPTDATAGDLWQALDGQTQRLDLANGRTADLIAMADECQAQQQAAAKALQPKPWWRF